MRIRHLLLLAALVAAGSSQAADPGPNVDAAKAKARAEVPAPAQADPAWSLMASEQLRTRPANRNRVRYTFPPSTKRM